MKKIAGNTLVRLSVLIVVMAFLVIFSAVRLESNELRNRSAELSAQIEEMQDYIEVLKADAEHPLDREYLEDLAHSNGYCYPQETVFSSDND